MRLPEFGLLCLKKNGTALDKDILYTIRTLNEKFAQACIACLKNSDLVKAKERAEISDKLKSAFIENISHEIRTPLNAIIGYSSLIADKQITPKMLAPACKSIVQSSNSLLEIIEGLLDVSMLQSGNVRVKYALSNVNQFLADQEEVFNRYVRQEQKEALNMRVVTPENNIFIVTDTLRLQQIFDNLISNAVRFTNSGEIEIGYTINDGNYKNKEIISVNFYVKDKGVGIPEKEHKNIFKPFSKFNYSRDKLYGGTGVGLSITKKLVELLQGTLSLESEPGKGTTIYFTIPSLKSVDALTSNL
jgi:signal transduction histidine kinase